MGNIWPNVSQTPLVRFLWIFLYNKSKQVEFELMEKGSKALPVIAVVRHKRLKE